MDKDHHEANACSTQTVRLPESAVTQKFRAGTRRAGHLSQGIAQWPGRPRRQGASDFYRWGQTLGKLHHTMDQIPQALVAKRITWKDHLDFAKQQMPKGDLAFIKEIEQIEKWAESTAAKTGLIHYDFELDNLHWYPDTIKMFDFDDSAVYWYGADIAYALRDLFHGKIDTEHPQYKRFMSGYLCEFEVDENLNHDLQMFMKLHALYAYPRILRSLDYEIKEDSPDWIKGLTGKLTNYAEGLRKSIGMLR